MTTTFSQCCWLVASHGHVDFTILPSVISSPVYVICSFTEIWGLTLTDITGSTILTCYDASVELIFAKGISSLEIIITLV